MNSVDFTEIESPLDWEFFAEAFFRAKGNSIIQGPSTGSDGGTGKDLIIEETLSSEYGNIIRRILVSCKHFAKSGKSVNASDEKASVTNLIAENCSGFLGFYSTSVSSPLQSIIFDIKKNERIKIDIANYYDSEDIEEFLLFGDEENTLLKRFFPESYKKWKKLSSKDAEQNPNFKKLSEEDFKTKSKDYYKKYYEGQPPDWSIVRKYTFKRDCFDYVIQQLETNSICLVTGAGGEGKTTLLMQLGDYYLNKGFCVLYSFSSIINLDLSELKFKPNKKYLFIIDNANAISNLSAFVKNVKLSKNVFALLASRKNEWDYSLANCDDKEDLNRWIGKFILLHKLTNNEITVLSELLQKHKILNEEVKEKLLNFINDNTHSNFLLAIMIYATQEKSFDLIIKNVIDRIRGWKDSQKTIEAIGYIVCLEVLVKGAHGQVYCQETLLKKLLQIINFEQYLTIKKHLAEEAFFQGSLTNIIRTRNPVIAKIYFDCLFKSEPQVLDIYEFYYNIIREASISNKKYDKDILALIPFHFRASDELLSIQLLKDAISYGFFWNTYYWFIDKEILKENIGSYDSTEYSARWLFFQAFSKNSKDSQLFVRWAKFELHYSALGAIDLEYSPRWIFHFGTKMSPSSNLFELWAIIEAKAGNIGHNVEDEYSARWICKQGYELTLTSNLLAVWANIEVGEGNIGYDVEDEYSARWICKKGYDLTPRSELLGIWATIEAGMGNIGRDINDKYSARWICINGIEKKDLKLHEDLYVIWANIEANEGNIGVDVNDEYSARWICNQIYKKSSYHGVFNTWARIENENNNTGDIETMYSARWILKCGLDKHYHKEIIYNWLKLELQHNNIGSSNEPYSGQWLFEYCMKMEQKSKFIIQNIEVKDAAELKLVWEKKGEYDLPNSENSSLITYDDLDIQ